MNLFISFDWDDRDRVNGFRGMLGNPQVRDLSHRDTSVKEDYSEEGKAYIKQHITNKIAVSDVTVCLISHKTRNSGWVNWELECSRLLRKPVVGIVLPDSG
ncbi:MAG: TIR domain-containing protein, partial [Myxococcota bacterium]